MSKTSEKRPSLLRRTYDSIVEETSSWGELLRAEWRLVLLLCFGVLILLSITRPLPPKDVYLAVGQEGSTFEALGRKFVPYFAEEGIRLHLVHTKGSVESLTELADKDVQVNAALMVSGVASQGSFPDLVSLGSVEYIPLWLFYRGPEVPGKGSFATNFASKRIAVGPEGSATEIMIKKLLELSGISLDQGKNFLKLSNKEAAEKLIAGEIDAACIMDGINGPNVSQLLLRKDIHIFNFIYAPAYVKKLPFLDTVVIPMGALDLKNNRPEHDIRMLASTSSILVEKKTHPVVQQIFLLAAKKISGELDQFFAKPELFPAYMDHIIPLSPVAKRFYDEGPPALRNTVPLWLINYVDRIWFLLVGVIAVVYPLFKLFPSYRRMHSVMLITDAYEQIHRVELQLLQAQTQDELAPLAEALDELLAEIRESRIATDELNRLYSMRGALNLVRQQIANRRQELSSAAAT